jgi:hypothetical protein
VTKGAPRRDHAQEKTPGAHIKLSYHIYIGRVDKRWHDPRDHRSHLADPAKTPGEAIDKIDRLSKLTSDMSVFIVRFGSRKR